MLEIPESQTIVKQMNETLKEKVIKYVEAKGFTMQKNTKYVMQT